MQVSGSSYTSIALADKIVAYNQCNTVFNVPVNTFLMISKKKWVSEAIFF